MTRARILIADDEPLYRRTTAQLLEQAGYECVCVADAAEALRRLQQGSFDLLLSDLNMPGNLKLELLHDHSRRQPGVPVIVITGVPSLPSAIESIRLGIADYLLKPVKVDDLLASVRRALRRGKSAARPGDTSGPAAPVSGSRLPGVIGDSAPMRELFEIVQRVAGTDTNVLITGESGTGKEVIAHAIHRQSRRHEATFQVIDCTAVPESLFESMLFGHKKGAFTGAVGDQPGLLKECDGGTAFFDELGELPLPLQAKLLRAVQEQTFTPLGSQTPVTVDTRFICATNRDLQMEVNAGRFRRDLFYRLAVIHLELPPLRERGDDVVRLAEHFLQKLRPEDSPVTGFAPDTLRRLREYPWPGNVRELRNVIERTIALSRGPLIEVSDLPETVRHAVIPRGEKVPERMGGPPAPELAEPGRGRSLPEVTSQMAEGLQSPLPFPLEGASREETLKAAEYQYLVHLLTVHSGNVSEAARQAGLSRQGMHKLLKQHDLHAADFRRS